MKIFSPRSLPLLLLLAPFGGAQAAEALRYDCTLMAQQIGAPATQMVPAPNQGWQLQADEARLVCAWHTQAGAKAAAGQVLNREDYKDVGALTAQLVVYAAPLQRKEAAMMNAAFDTPEGLAPEAAWLFALKTPDMAGKLGILPPEIMLGDIGVSVSYANSFTTEVGTGSPLTVGWSVEAAARILAAAVAAR